MWRQRTARWWQHVKNVYHFWQAHAWRLYYGRPERRLALYGVTGTNGKTTTCYLLDSILATSLGRERVGMLTTVAGRIGGREEINETKLTTLPSRLVYRKLQDMLRAGVTHAVLEMTSHALDQHRLAGVRIAGAIILNIEREHLDYHGTMEAYARAKGRMVDYLKPAAPLVVKRDDEWVAKALGAIFTSPHSLSSPEEREPGRGEAGGVNVIAFTAAQAQAVATPLPGAWNKENVLAASLLARAIGIDERAITRGVAAVRQVPGRMEWVGTRVLIDYAVTPGALARLYREVRQLVEGKVLAVLGAAGLRDRGKRADMARAVAQYADELVLTREDPWSEDEEQIFRDLEQGLVGARIPWRRVVDRREAMRYCLARAGPGDVVVVTGKGAESGMALGKEIVPWSDREVIWDLLKELENARGE